MFSIFTSHATVSGTPVRKRYATLPALLLLYSGLVAAGQTPLSFEEALRLATAASASAKASSAAVAASSQAAAKAGQLPDPMLKLGIDNLPVSGPDKFRPNADFMTMRRVGIEQQWVSKDKRRARSERAQRAVEASEGSYLETVATVREAAGKAWLTVLYKQRALALVESISRAMEQDLETLKASYRGAKVAATDVLQAKAELIQSGDAINAAEQELEIARINLRRWTRTDIARVADSLPALSAHVPNLPASDLDRYHPAVLNALRAVSLADAEKTVAIRDRNPDWAFEAGFAQRSSQYSNMVSFGVSIPLNVNRAQRQDRDIAEKSELGTKARLEYEDTLVDMQSTISALAAQLETLKRRVSRLNAELLPNANQLVDLTLSDYQAGKGSLTAVFKARRASLSTRLQVNALELEAALVWASLELHVIPHDMADQSRTTQ
jgi:outer membrane protein TolC